MGTVISKDGTKIAYDRSGSGPVVILVGGALQSKSDHLMGRLSPLLAKDFTVISYDRRGRGESTDTKPYDPLREIEDLEALIKETGGKAYVFGNSSGGNLALLAAAKLQNIGKVAVYEAPFINDELSNATEYISELKKYNKANQPGKALKLFFKKIGMPTPMVLVMSLTPMWRGMKALAHTLLYDGIIVDDGKVPQQLKNISVPVLALTGSSDRMQQAAKDLINIVPKAQHKILAGQTHDVNPALLSSALVKFFEK